MCLRHPEALRSFKHCPHRGPNRMVPGPPHQPTSLLADGRDSPALPSATFLGGSAAGPGAPAGSRAGLRPCTSRGPAPLSSSLCSEPAGLWGPRLPDALPPHGPGVQGFTPQGTRGGLPGAPQGAGQTTPSLSSFLFRRFVLSKQTSPFSHGC